MKSPLSFPLTAALLLLLVAPLAAEEAPKSSGDAPATVTVRRGPLGGTVETKGTVVPARYERVTIEFKAYRGKLEIAESVPEGPVVKGQTLLRFEDEDYKEVLATSERDLEIKRLGLERAERLHALSKTTLALKRDEVMRSKRLAEEALDRFQKVERKLREEDAKYSFKGRSISILNMREELAQLEKMYTEDDLTEETEEIVLKRNRRNMERMLESFERYKNRHEYSLKTSLPREHEKLRLAVRRAVASFERLQATESLERASAELGMEGSREGFAKAEKALAELKEDGAAFTLKAPMAGYAVRGSFVQGGWKGLDSDEAYEAGETMKSGQTPYTIVDESTMRVHTTVKEADVASIKAGATASIKTDLTGDDALEAEVALVARYGAGGSYRVVLRVKAKDARLRTGIRCKAEIHQVDRVDVLSIPASAMSIVDEIHLVWGIDGKSIPIKIGKTVGDRVEVTEGLTAGQKIRAEPGDPVEKIKEAEAGDDSDK